MNSGEEPVAPRGDYPTTSFPDQKTQLSDMPLNLAYIPKIAPFAIATYPREADAYLDAETLRLSYQSAYRLLFARQVVDLLRSGSDGKVSTVGQRAYTTQAIIVVPSFAYIATALLSCIGALAIGLLVMTMKRSNRLRNDPATIGRLMVLVTESPETAKTFMIVQEKNSHDLDAHLSSINLELKSNAIENAQLFATAPSRTRDPPAGNCKPEDLRFTNNSVRPTEMKAVIGFSFLTIQIAALITFLALFVQCRAHGGLPLPSMSTFVTQLVENYIPIALATFIEPFWLVLNRLLGLLQPFKELRKGDASSSKSVDLDHSSLPPQLLLTRALRARNYVLALLCTMGLLANVLSVALSGLMYEGTVNISGFEDYAGLKDGRFRALNGTSLPFNTNQTANSQGGTTSTPFYRQMSNLTARTPLPAWTDQRYAYVPVDLGNANDTPMMALTTGAFGASLQCTSLATTGEEHYSMSFEPDAAVVHTSFTLQNEKKKPVNCTNSKPWTRSYSTAETSLDYLRDSQTGHLAIELNGMLSSNASQEENLFCRQHMLSTWMRAEWRLLEGKEAGDSIRGLPKMELISNNVTMLLCTPTIEICSAEIVVNSDGRVQELLSANTSTKSLDQYFTSTPQDLIAQANQFIVDSDATWNNDSYPSDYLNYLIKEITNDTSLLDPSLPPPSASGTAAHLSEVYRRLFAILVSTNTDYLLQDASPRKQVTVRVTKPETRILVSTPAIIVTEIILICYICTTILFYAHRPWIILTRLPSTVASNIAYFAGSRALGELAEMKEEERIRARRSWRWGCGKFVKTDGKVGFGIEREPFVSVVTALQKKNMETKMRGKKG